MIDCKYGKVFHRIRQDKGASLATAAAGIMSKQGLSAFENGKSMITLDKFFKLINQLNIDINEYIACITEQHLPKNNLNRLVMAYRRQDQHFLRQMQVKFKQWYAVYHREHDLHLMIVIKVLLKELGQQVNITTAEINTIHPELFIRGLISAYRTILDQFSCCYGVVKPRCTVFAKGYQIMGLDKFLILNFEHTCPLAEPTFFDLLHQFSPTVALGFELTVDKTNPDRRGGGLILDKVAGRWSPAYPLL